jgi:hypothetical protein
MKKEPHPADLIRLYKPRQVLVTKSSRKRAKKHACDEFRYFCFYCALEFISWELAARLCPEGAFALPRPLSRESARRWTPPTPDVGHCQPPV